MIRIQNRFQEQEVTCKVLTHGWQQKKAAGSSGSFSAGAGESGGEKDICEERQIELLEEHELAIYVNDILTMRVVCTAQDLAELTLGRLLSEGVIHSLKDVDYLYICSQGIRAKVYLSRERNLKAGDSGEEDDLPLPHGQGEKQARVRGKDPYVDVTPSCCTDNRTFHETFVQERELKPLPPGTWSPEQVYGIAKTFFSEDTPVHHRTGSAHSCFLLRGGEILFSAEDMGRHNALDKAIGWALLQGVDFSETAVFTSGRVPADVARKVIRAGIPVLISRKMPTGEAVKLAVETGLTLIGKARENSFILFT